MSNLPATQSEASNASSELIQLVSFNLEKEEYGINVLTVREIIRMISITRVPNIGGHFPKG